MPKVMNTYRKKSSPRPYPNLKRLKGIMHIIKVIRELDKKKTVKFDESKNKIYYIPIEYLSFMTIKNQMDYLLE